MFRVFHTPDVLFARLFAAAGPGAHVFVRRFESQGRAAGMRAVANAEDGARAYAQEGYVLIYMTLTAAPRSASDLAFAERASEELIEVAGGRLDGQRLEVAVARCVAKASRAKALFRRVRETLCAGCTAGVVETRTRTPYLDTLVGAEARELELVEKLENERIHYSPV